MNPFLQALLLALIRSALLWLAGHLGVQSTEAEVAAAALTLFAAGWSIYDKYKSHQQLLTAQASAQVTRQEVDTIVKAGVAPPVMTKRDEVPQLQQP
jgi:hypothetical protein